MHWDFFCRWQQRFDVGLQRLDGREQHARRRGLLRDSPAYVTPDAEPSGCRDARHLFVPLARTPSWTRGTLALPVARRLQDGAQGQPGVGLPVELWRSIVDGLDDDLDDLLGLRSSSKFFARLVDEKAALLFGPRVRRQVLAHRLVALPTRCARAMFANTASLRWELTRKDDATQLTRLLACMPQLEVLELFGTAAQPASEMAVPTGLRALTVTGLRMRRADAWLSQLPRGLQQLTLCDAVLPLRRTPAWPPGLQALSLQDCTWGHSTTLDLAGLDDLTSLEVSAHDAPRGKLGLRLPGNEGIAQLPSVAGAAPPGPTNLGGWTVRQELGLFVFSKRTPFST